MLPCYWTWSTVALAGIHQSVLNREIHPHNIFHCCLYWGWVCVEHSLPCVKASDLLWPWQWVPACAAAAGVVPMSGTVMATKCQWASGLVWTVIKCLCPNVSSSVAFPWGLRWKMGNVWNSAGVWRIRFLVHCCWSELHLHQWTCLISVSMSAIPVQIVLPISFYRPSPVYRKSC